jgi:cyclic pyranopterin phosphate synthase
MSRPFPLPLGDNSEPNSVLGTPYSVLTDSFGRPHNNLRVSVTDRCNLRCTYCMPEEVAFLDKGELLTFEEMTHFVRVATGLGIDKVRLTGGEPLLRRGLPTLVRMLTSVPGVRDLGLTTNALLLAAQAPALYDAGLRRLNVSLDTLDPARFRQLARRDGLDQVLAGIDAARAAGFERIKVNAVILRGVNDPDVVPLARYARGRGLEMRFIEYMPIGGEPWERDKVVFAHELLETLEREVAPLAPAEDYDPRAPAMDFRYLDGGGRVGMIASVSRPFCRSCNRLRLTAEGRLRNCLFALDELDVKPMLRGTPDDAGLADALRRSVAAKWEGHEINTARFVKPTRTMHAIGG